MKIIKSILAFVLTRVRIQIPEVLGLKPKYFIFQSNSYHSWSVGIDFHLRSITLNLLILSIHITKEPKRYIYRSDNDFRPSLGSPVNLSHYSEHAMDVVMDEAIKFERSVRRKLKLSEEEVGFSSSAHFNTEDKVLYIEPFLYVEMKDMVLPKTFVGRHKQRLEDKQFEWRAMSFDQKIIHQDYWDANRSTST